MKKILLVVVLMGLTACSSSLSTKDCAPANWRDKGASDVAQGTPVTQFYEYQKICAKVGVVPDEAAYVEGYMKGQAEYCTHENGFKAGKHGKRLGETCPSGSEFVKGFIAGREAYAEEKEKRQADSLTRGGTSIPNAPGGSR